MKTIFIWLKDEFHGEVSGWRLFRFNYFVKRSCSNIGGRIQKPSYLEMNTIVREMRVNDVQQKHTLIKLCPWWCAVFSFCLINLACSRKKVEVWAIEQSTLHKLVYFGWSSKTLVICLTASQIGAINLYSKLDTFSSCCLQFVFFLRVFREIASNTSYWISIRQRKISGCPLVLVIKHPNEKEGGKNVGTFGLCPFEGNGKGE